MIEGVASQRGSRSSRNGGLKAIRRLVVTGRRAALAILLALAAGCGSQGADGPFDEYLTRVGRTLDVEPVAPQQVKLPLPPRPGAVRLDLASGSIDTLDFLALTGCELQVTIGKRNSSLGRMAAPSQRLLLELEFLRLAPPCIDHLRKTGRTELAGTLQEAGDLKRTQLPALIFNATLAGQEYRDFWRARSLPPDYPGSTGSAVVSALGAVTAHSRRWLAGDYEADNLAFELLLSEIAVGDGGELLRALAHQAGWMAAANRMLREREARGPLCTDRIRPAAADILPNVVRKFFIGDIQPRAAALGRRYHELTPVVAELESLLGAVLPAAYRDWQRDRDALLSGVIGAPRLHVTRLQSLLRPCSAGTTAAGVAGANPASGVPM